MYEKKAILSTLYVCVQLILKVQNNTLQYTMKANTQIKSESYMNLLKMKTLKTLNVVYIGTSWWHSG